MRYYLETNALYSIDKINKTCGDDCFTSIFSLFELISGLKEENFSKRKNLFIKLHESQIGLDKKFPEEIIFDSFDVMKGYEFVEDRVSALNTQIQGIINSKNFEDFEAFNKNNQIDFNFDFFRFTDDKWNNGFVNATVEGNKRISKVLEKENKTIFDNEQIVELKNNKDLKKFFEFEPALSKSISIVAFAGFLKNYGIDSTEEEIYESYNGLIEQYIQCLSDYSDDKMIKSETPSKNDFSDLTHLLYLRNDNEKAIVTDDKIFRRYFRGNVLNVNELIEKIKQE